MAVKRKTQEELEKMVEKFKKEVCERKQAEEKLCKSEYEKSILNQIANIFLTVPDEAMYGEVLAIVLRVMRSTYGLFGFIGDQGELIIPSLTRDIWNECQVSDKSLVFPSDSWGESIWGRAIKEKKSFYSDGPFRTPEGHIHIDCFLTVPIVFGQQTIGLLSVADKEGGYTEEDKELLERIVGNISPILNARLQRDRLEQERKRAEQQMFSLQAQLQQSQKMEAIGQLAGGVAHDFNNLLTIITLQCQLSLRGLRDTDPLKEKLKDIEQAAEQAANLTRQLLAFSRRQILEMKVTDLNIILRNLEKMLRRVIGENIALKTALTDKLGLVKVDPGQIEQVVMNLAVNARDAMPQGGKLFLETANVELDKENDFFQLGMLPGDYVMLSITDTGIGMTKEVKKQIFDPFFTTKQKGKGTGLGLSTVYGIVKQSGGDIYVYSEVGKGTTFKIYFPRVFERGEELEKKETGKKVPQGTETILVVEDEGPVRKLAIDILRKQGYTVLEATEGAEALLICEQQKRPIHLILTDVVMPKMSGPQFIEQLKQMRKDFKVVYMSGYTDEAIMNNGILEEEVNLINKPFTFEKLASKVREVLDKN